MRKQSFILMVWILILLILVPGSLAQDEPSTHVVVILVVDDFTPNTVEGIVGQVADQTNEVCYFNIAGQAMADGMGDGEDAEGKPLPHGDLILSQVLDLLTLDKIRDYRISRQVEHEGEPPVVITAIPVHVEGYTLANMGPQIRATMELIEEAILNAEIQANIHYVINMSFALVPCGEYRSLAELLSNLDPADREAWQSFQNLMEDITFDPENRRDGPSARELVNELCAPSEQAQGGRCELASILKMSHVIGVASAGNFGLDFPTLPGAFETVVSVSAGQECGGFDSAGTEMNRIMFLAPTFIDIDLELLPDPCQPSSGMTPSEMLHEIAPDKIVYFSSRGEIMMPGMWNYVASLQWMKWRLLAAYIMDIVGYDEGLISLGLYRPLYKTFYGEATHVPNNTAVRMIQHDMDDWLNRAAPLSPRAMGTSFSAPRFSVAMALYLAERLDASAPSNVCLRKSFKSPSPTPANVIGFSYGEFPDSQSPVEGPWLDISLAEQGRLKDPSGANANCDDFYASDVPSLLMITPIP